MVRDTIKISIISDRNIQVSVQMKRCAVLYPILMSIKEWGT
jgi:hypothetical protein